VKTTSRGAAHAAESIGTTCAGGAEIFMLIDGRYCQPIPTGLTRMPAKAILYSLDTHFRAGWEDLVEVAGDASTALLQRHAFVLVRPDAVVSRRIEAILDWLSLHGFSIVDGIPVAVDRHQVRALWQFQWNVALRERRDACDALMGTCASLLLVIRDDDPSSPGAAGRFRRLKGAADPALRRVGELRTVLGHRSRMLSLLHSPDEPADVVRELAILLPPARRRALFERLGRGETSAVPALLAVACAVYERAGTHSLDLAGSLDRVEAAALAVLPGDAALRDRVLAPLGAMRRGERVDWRACFAGLDAHGVPYRPLDRTVIAGHVVAMDEPGRRVLVGHPPAEGEGPAGAGESAAAHADALFIDASVGAPLPPGLTELPRKAALFAIDTWFREGWEDACAVAGPDATDLLRRHALVLVKPDAFAARRVETILDWLPGQGLTVVAFRRVTVTGRHAQALWQHQWNAAPRQRQEALTALLEAGDSLLLVVRSDATSDAPSDASASKRFAHLKGSADPALRRPGDLRARLGCVAHLVSFVHAADEPADVARELAILLSEAERVAVYRRMQAGDDVRAEALAAVVGEILDGTPRCALDVDAATRRLEEAVRRAAGGAPDDVEPVLAVLRRVRAGGSADTRAVFAWLDRRAVPCDAWDRITVMAHASDVSLPHVRPLLPGAVPMEADAAGTARPQFPRARPTITLRTSP
jgi:nucleoside diphosphate kinase